MLIVVVARDVLIWEQHLDNKHDPSNQFNEMNEFNCVPQITDRRKKGRNATKIGDGNSPNNFNSKKERKLNH